MLFTASPITAPSPCPPPPPPPATRLLPLPGLRTSCCHPHPSPFVSTTHVDRSDRSPPLPPVPSSSHCSARRHIKMLLGLFVSVDLGGGKSTVRRRRRRKSEAGSKHLKGDGARSSQMCTNGHSPPPPHSPPLSIWHMSLRPGASCLSFPVRRRSEWFIKGAEGVPPASSLQLLKRNGRNCRHNVGA